MACDRCHHQSMLPAYRLLLNPIHHLFSHLHANIYPLPCHSRLSLHTGLSAEPSPIASANTGSRAIHCCMRGKLHSLPAMELAFEELPSFDVKGSNAACSKGL